MDRKRIADRIGDLVGRYREAGYFPSACVRVFDDRETLFCCCFGEAEETSLFDVASLTKIATAAQVLRLIDEGALSLDTTLEEVFPQVREDRFLRERLRGADLYRLLTHTSSIPAWYPFYVRAGEDFFAVLTHALRTLPRAEGAVYSDLNFMLLGKLLEKTRGKPLERCLREDLAEPLGLGRIRYLPGAGEKTVPSSFGNPIEKRMCAERGLSFGGFRPDDAPVRGQVNDGNCHYYFGGVSGHAGIFADAAAYERLCRYFMNTDSPLLQRAQREQPDAPGRGLGFQTGMTYPHGCGHTGFTGTSIYFSRGYRIGAVAFTNRLYFREESGKDLSEFRRALHEAVFALGATA